MISPEYFHKLLKQKGVGIFAGVPDSLLKNFCAHMEFNCGCDEHIITANEGNAIALAAGYHLATGKTGAVYMQNSGLGNCVNPLTSLADPEVYSIPMLLVIGWRGEPGLKDEPQHVKQGRITPGQLELLEVPYQILQADSNVEMVLDKAFQFIKDNNAPAALLVRKNTFASCKNACKRKDSTFSLKREEALRSILNLADTDDLFVSTTGKTSRELFELRAERGETQRDFLTVGSMGHTLSIAVGTAIGMPDKRVICLDGDGSAIMHMGSMPVTGSLKPENLVHVLLNNMAHESVGGQPTVAGSMDFAAISRACGYSSYYLATDVQSLSQAWENIKSEKGPQMLEIRIKKGSREDLGRPTSTPAQNKQAFMDAVHG